MTTQLKSTHVQAVLDVTTRQPPRTYGGHRSGSGSSMYENLKRKQIQEGRRLPR